MTVPALLSVVTLGVSDVARSTAFYAALGWRISSASVPGDVTFLDLAGSRLALWGDADLARDAGAQPPTAGSFRGISLALNLASRAAVDSAVAAMTAAGGTLVSPAAHTFYGGYAAYVADPDGYRWEVVFNPGFPLGGDGLPVLP
jgi:catechol 2,3-dioxygenase-like lactoylglutathione lyase family enzyme